MNHLLTMNDLGTQQIYNLLEKAKLCKTQPPVSEENRFIANLFYEPSTRTKMSFEVAEKKLGFHTLDFSPSSSSVEKGESLYDTVKTIEAIGASAVVIRHKEEKYYEQLKNHVSIPIINGGDGKGEHPTQCLLDLYTIFDHFGYLEGLNIVISGDILHSRVARSNAWTLRRLGANIFLSGPKVWHDPTMQFPYVPIEEAIKECDVLMLLRVQRERHEGSNTLSDNSFLFDYGLTVEREKQMAEESIILHPGPVNRDVEIAQELIECERSKILTQVENGVYVRMAVLQSLLPQGGRKIENTIKTSKVI